MREILELRATLSGHTDWVTKVAIHPSHPDRIVSTSRDRSILMWKLTGEESSEYAVPWKRLTGHSHFISDLVFSPQGEHALSSSWDKTIRLWDLAAGKTIRNFVGHTKDVLTVDFSADGRYIVSGSRDKTIKLWNTLGKCKYEMSDNPHTDWVSCVRFAPHLSRPILVSVGWDRLVKIWDISKCSLLRSHADHKTGYLNCVSIAPDSSMCATGGSDSKAILTDLRDGEKVHSWEQTGIISAMCFNPTRVWVCVAIGPSIKIWDLESKQLVSEIQPPVDVEEKKTKKKSNASLLCCLSLTWSHDGKTLFAGYSDNVIRVWKMKPTECATSSRFQLLC